MQAVAGIPVVRPTHVETAWARLQELERFGVDVERNGEEVWLVVEHGTPRVVGGHGRQAALEALDHCGVSRSELRARLAREGLSAYVPEDGEVVDLGRAPVATSDRGARRRCESVVWLSAVRT